MHILDPTADTARHLAFGPPAGTPARKFDFAIGKLERDAVMDITLEDTDGIASQRPHRITIDVLPDEPPDVDVSLQGIGTAITADARLP